MQLGNDAKISNKGASKYRLLMMLWVEQPHLKGLAAGHFGSLPCARELIPSYELLEANSFQAIGALIVDGVESLTGHQQLPAHHGFRLFITGQLKRGLEALGIVGGR